MYNKILPQLDQIAKKVHDNYINLTKCPSIESIEIFINILSIEIHNIYQKLPKCYTKDITNWSVNTFILKKNNNCQVIQYLNQYSFMSFLGLLVARTIILNTGNKVQTKYKRLKYNIKGAALLGNYSKLSDVPPHHHNLTQEILLYNKIMNKEDTLPEIFLISYSTEQPPGKEHANIQYLLPFLKFNYHCPSIQNIQSIS